MDDSAQSCVIRDKNPEDEKQCTDYLCEVCMARFEQKSDFARHVKVHTGLTPHYCPYCSNCYSEALMLRRHIAWEHREEQPDNIDAWPSDCESNSCDELEEDEGEDLGEQNEAGNLNEENVVHSPAKQESALEDGCNLEIDEDVDEFDSKVLDSSVTKLSLEEEEEEEEEDGDNGESRVSKLQLGSSDKSEDSVWNAHQNGPANVESKKRRKSNKLSNKVVVKRNGLEKCFQMKRHAGEGAEKERVEHCCDCCGETFSTESDLLRHKGCYRNCQLKGNWLKDNIEKTVVCSFEIIPTKVIQKQTESEKQCTKKSPSNRFVCPVCEKRHNSGYHLRRHLKTVKDGKCAVIRNAENICEERRWREATPKCALTKESAEWCTLYVCKICWARFKQKMDFVWHSGIHTSGRPYRCPHCGGCFPGVPFLLRHVTREHREPNSTHARPGDGEGSSSGGIKEDWAEDVVCLGVKNETGNVNIQNVVQSGVKEEKTIGSNVQNVVQSEVKQETAGGNIQNVVQSGVQQEAAASNVQNVVQVGVKQETIDHNRQNVVPSCVKLSETRSDNTENVVCSGVNQEIADSSTENVVLSGVKQEATDQDGGLIKTERITDKFDSNVIAGSQDKREGNETKLEGERGGGEGYRLDSPLGSPSNPDNSAGDVGENRQAEMGSGKRRNSDGLSQKRVVKRKVWEDCWEVEGYPRGISVKREVFPIRRSRDYGCDSCGETFDTDTDLLRHSRCHSNCDTKDDWLKSDVGEQSLNSYETVSHEVTQKQTQGQKYRSKKSVSDKFVCPVCQKRHSSGYHLRRHLKSLKDGKCAVIRNAERLHKKRRRVRKTTGAEKERVDKQRVEKKGTEKQRVGSKGSKLYALKRRGIKRTGVAKQGALKKRAEKRERKRFMCNICGARFDQKSDLLRHGMSHTGQKPHRCAYCANCYSRASILRKHMARQHAGQMADSADGGAKSVAPPPAPASHACEMCDAEFYSVGNLARHQLNTHGPTDGAYTCEYCGHLFRRLDVLKKHAAARHAETKNFACDICSKKFVTRDYLRTHIQRHLKHGQLVPESLSAEPMSQGVPDGKEGELKQDVIHHS